MLKLKDANVLIVKTFPNKNISISSMMFSLGIKQHKVIHLNGPSEPLTRTFHERFDILICDQSYNRDQVKASDLLWELKKSKTIDDRSTVIMDCLGASKRDISYYLADVHLTSDDSQREISDLIRKVFDKKNTVWPLLHRNQSLSGEEMAKQYHFFEQHYPEYKYDIMFNRAHQHLAQRNLKAAAELYSALIKESNKKDYSMEVSFFLNTLELNDQCEDALKFHGKFTMSKVSFGQPFEDVGALLLLKSGHLDQAYQVLLSSDKRYGSNSNQRTILGLLCIVMGKYEAALAYFSSNLVTAKLLSREVPYHTLNYMFGLLMLWMKYEKGHGLYEKKFEQMLKEVLRFKLNDAETQQLNMIRLHADCLVIGSQHAESVINTLIKKMSKLDDTSKFHALYLASGLSNKTNFTQLQSNVLHCDTVFMFSPLPPVCSALVKLMDFNKFSNEMNDFQRIKAETLSCSEIE